MSAPLTPCWG